MATISDKMLQRFFEVLQASKLPAELQELLAAPTSSHFCVIQQGENDALKISMPNLRGKLGNYNASTNTPSLSHGSGIEGDSYLVTTGGSRDFGSGSVDLAAGDILEHRNGEWLKVGFALTKAAMIAALGYTPEDQANKAIDFSVINDTVYPSVKAVEDRLNSASITDKNYVHDQGADSATWNITHNLNKHPSVTVRDTSSRIVEGEVTYVDNNSLTIEFNAPFSGTATLN